MVAARARSWMTTMEDQMVVREGRYELNGLDVAGPRRPRSNPGLTPVVTGGPRRSPRLVS